MNLRQNLYSALIFTTITTNNNNNNNNNNNVDLIKRTYSFEPFKGPVH